MPVWLTIVLALGGSALISTVIGFIATRILKNMTAKKDREKEEAEKKALKDKADLETFRYQRERQERFNDTKMILDQAMKSLNQALKDFEKRFDYIDQRLAINSEANLAGLRNDILNFYYLCVAKGYRSDEDYINMEDMYQAYVKLDGNTFVEDKIKEFRKLSTKEQYKKNKSKKEKEEKEEKDQEGGNN